MIILIPGLLIVGLVAIFAWPTRDRHVAVFAQIYQIPLTDETVAPLRATIRRSRRIRWALGCATAVAFMMTRSDVGPWGILGALAVGFGIGSIVDELTRPAPPRHAHAAASLDRRSIRNYAERWVLVAVGVALILVGFEGWRALVVERPVNSFAPPWSDAAIAGAIALAWLSAIVGAVALNRIVQHSAPADSIGMQTLRHGLRVAGVLSVLGAILVVICTVGITLASFTLLASEPEPFNWIHAAVAISFALGFYLGLVLSVRAFPSGRWSTDLPELPLDRHDHQTAP